MLDDAQSLERAAYEVGIDCLAEGVRYLELRFAPQLHVRRGFDVAAVLAAVDRGLERVRREHEQSDAVRVNDEPPFRYGLITCAMRMFTGGFGPYFSDLYGVLDKSPPTEVYGIASLALVRSVVEARDRLGIPVESCALSKGNAMKLKIAALALAAATLAASTPASAAATSA